MSLLAAAFSSLQIQARRGISVTACLFAEPLKKKKKIDPAIIKQREERKRKKIEKQIRRLEKNARQLKPIEELEVPIELLDEKNERLRKVEKLSLEEIERRALLIKDWTRYKHEERVKDFQIIDHLVQSQKIALQELRHESQELYDQAIQLDLLLLPLELKGPVATPPIPNYSSPDGDYFHKAKKWDN